MMSDERLREHPELAALLGLGTLLDVLPQVLIAVHTDGPSGPLQDQARSMIRVSRILADQLSAYVGIIDLGEPESRARRLRAS